MAKKKAGTARGSAGAKNKVSSLHVQTKEKAGTDPVLAKLSEAEQDLVWHVEHGYGLETDSRGGNPLLRRMKDDEVVRPASANRNTIKVLEERRLIAASRGQRSAHDRVAVTQETVAALRAFGGNGIPGNGARKEHIYCHGSAPLFWRF